MARRAHDVEAWLVRRLAERLGVAPDAIDTREPFAGYGLSSRDAVVLTGELEEWLDQTLSPTIFWEQPTIEALARFLGGSPATITSEPAGRSDDPIAIVGIGCRFPGAPDPGAFWNLLRSGTDAIREIPPDRWDGSAFDTTSRCGGFLDDVYHFEPDFFCISPREAVHMDPQQRLLLEVTWEALENAGIAPDSLYGSATGVFVGISTNDYAATELGDPDRVEAYAGTGNAHSIAANRLSFLLDLHGPSMAVDTACSSSLVAVHLACQSLRTAECRVALAAGVNVILTPQLTLAFSKAGMMAADGRCKTFDAAADGYVRGEGCGVVVLKRLADALADGDQVLAVVRGSAVNQDGLSNGLTAPNGIAQREVIRTALSRAGVAAHEVSYVEAHGTGTPLGDPIEFEALSAVLMPGRPPSRPCGLGSVKTNIGHLEAAAGIAGLLKTVLALVHREIPPHLHLRSVNPHIHVEQTQFVIPRTCVPWHSPEAPRRAGVSAFGFGGTNVHVILEEGPLAPAARAENEGSRLYVLSAQTASALRALAARHARRLENLPATDLEDACATTRRGRFHFRHRVAAVGATCEALSRRLAAFAGGDEAPDLVHGVVNHKPPSRVAFLFTGQGSQYAGMGKELYGTEPAFRQALDRCGSLLRRHLDVPLPDVLWPAADAPRLLDETAYTQPALFALEYALCELWRSLGVTPVAVMGHSVGEFAAACVAGVLGLDDAVRIVAERGRLMQELPGGGGMLAVFASEEECANAIRECGVDLSLAAVNGPADTVLSGPDSALSRVAERLTARNVKSRRLVVSHAFHSGLMEPMLDEFASIVAKARLGAPNIALVSNVTGEVASDVVCGPGYWRRHVRESVRFDAGMRALEKLQIDAFVEIGPGSALLALGQRCLPTSEAVWTASIRKGRTERAQLLESIGAVYCCGASVDWTALDGGHTRRKVPLPTYPFERQRLCTEVTQPRRADARLPAHPILGQRLPSPLSTIQFESQLTGPMEADAESFSERALAAMDAIAGTAARAVAELPVSVPLSLAKGERRVLQVVVHRGESRVEIFSRPEGVPLDAWTLHARATITDAPLGHDAISERVYRVAWRSAPRAAAAEQDLGRWLIVSDNDDAGAALASELNARRASAELVGLADVGDRARGTRGIVLLDSRGSCHSALRLVQGLLATGTVARIWTVTRNAQAVLEEDSIALEPAPLWGFARSLALEHPELWGGLIDVDERSPAVVVAEELLGGGGEDQVAYRAGRRYLPRLERAPLPSSSDWQVRADATYLVTGGLGGIGLAVSRWLVDRGARQLVLTGRRADTPSSAQRQQLELLEDRGAKVRRVCADVADRSAMAALIEELRVSLRGVFHAAGIASPGPCASLDGAALERVLAPKVSGARILHELTAGIELDCFVLFSSVASILGSRSLAPYAAANAFLDALAFHRASVGLPALSVSFGPWAEVGMTSAAERALLESIGMHALPTRDGVALLDQLLASRLPHAVAAHIDWAAFVPALEANARRPLIEGFRQPEVPAASEPSPFRRQLDEATPDARQALLVEWLQREVARVLGREACHAIDTTQGFFEMGLDSLMAVELKRRLERATGLTLPRTVAFEFPSIAALSRHLASACAPPPSPCAPSLPPTSLLSDAEAAALLLRELENLEQEKRA